MDGRLDGHAFGDLAEAAQEESGVDWRVVHRVGKWNDIRSDNLNARVKALGKPGRDYQGN